jgi:hypothetical protein
VDPESNVPAALFVDANSAKRQDQEIRLDGGASVRAGMLIDPNGASRRAARPQWMHTRWYGFALTFPDCDVFGG